MSETGANLVRLDAAEWYVVRRLVDEALLLEISKDEPDVLIREILLRALKSFHAATEIREEPRRPAPDASWMDVIEGKQ